MSITLVVQIYKLTHFHQKYIMQTLLKRNCDVKQKIGAIYVSYQIGCPNIYPTAKIIIVVG